MSSSARGRVGRFYRVARNLPDRLLHPRRHRAARRQISAAAPPKAILVVCYGNVCRSPYLQAVLQRDLPGTVVTSGGFVGSDRAPPELSIAISARRGIDLTRFRSRPLTPTAVSSADLIIVMDADQARQMVSRFPVSHER